MLECRVVCYLVGVVFFGALDVSGGVSAERGKARWQMRRAIESEIGVLGVKCECEGRWTFVRGLYLALNWDSATERDKHVVKSEALCCDDGASYVVALEESGQESLTILRLLLEPHHVPACKVSFPYFQHVQFTNAMVNGPFTM